MSGKCLILRGPTNCFKSTFASNFKPSSVVSFDDIRMTLTDTLDAFTEEFSVCTIANLIINSRLKFGLNVVIDSTNVSMEIVERYVDMSKAHNADVLIYSFIRSIEQIIEGNESRYVSTGDRTAYVPESIISGQVAAYNEETPVIAEVYGEIFTEFNISNQDISNIYHRLLKKNFKE